MWLTDAYVNSPWIVILVLMIVFLIAFAVVAAKEYHIMNQQHYREYLVWSDIRTERYDMRKAAETEIQNSVSGEYVPERSVYEADWSFAII